jgi:hypothetical protein
VGKIVINGTTTLRAIFTRHIHHNKMS